MIININENDYQYQYVAAFSTKKCIGDNVFCVYAELYNNFMTDGKTSILLSDVSVEGEIVEKDKIIVDAKINGDIKSDEIITHSKSNIVGNIKSKFASLGGKLKGNVNADRLSIKKTANIEGVLNQKTLSIQEGAQLKIKTETHK
tara:strand:+ start:196 stop:630 length:435 start_codon:yes stop_codon:yes gene_type:complete